MSYKHIVEQMRATNRRLETLKSNWDESQHPRDERGRFSPDGGGEAASPEPHARDERGHFTPTPFRTAALGDLLDRDQMKDVEKLITKIQSGKEKPEALREYLRTQESSLSERGVLPDYLYYAIANQAKLF